MLKKLALISCAAMLMLGLSACGRKGDLAPPPSNLVQPEAPYASL